MDQDRFLVRPGRTFTLRDHDPDDTGKFAGKEDAAGKLEKDLASLETLQGLLYAQDQHAVLVILQAMDAAGKDSVIKHVMSALNPQGVTVTSFKAPSASELDHDFLWRHLLVLPRRGEVAIFNRSYYEEVLVVRVHPELLERQRLPRQVDRAKIWKHRFEDINAFERYLSHNGVAVVKFFLHVSRKEQKKRFLERIDTPEKNWKFSPDDLKERALWDAYMDAYEQMLGETSTDDAPWYVIPADHKWYTRIAVADILAARMRALDLAYPPTTEEHRRELEESRRLLLEEDDKRARPL